MGYTANDIRNICLLGHGGDGKSALCESMLFTTKAITRLGKRADGTTVSDFDDEEKKRQYSISSSVIPVEYNKCKLNVIDNPGYFDFAGQIVQSLRVVDAGLICLTAKSGIGVGTEKGWKYLAKANLPAMFYVSKLDEEHANFFNVLDSLREMFGASVIPFTFPIMQGETAVGLVDLIEKKKPMTQTARKSPCPQTPAIRLKNTWPSSTSRSQRLTRPSWRSSSWKSRLPPKNSKPASRPASVSAA